MADWVPPEFRSQPVQMSTRLPVNYNSDPHQGMTHEGYKGPQLTPQEAAFGTGLAMGGTAGLAKYPVAAYNYANNGRTPGSQGGIVQPRSWSDSLDKANQDVADIRDAAPGSYLAGQLTGGTGLGFATGGVGGTGALANIGRNAVIGGMSGYNENQDVGQGLAGAGIGGAIGGAVPLIQGATNKAFQLVNANGLQGTTKILKNLVDNNDIDTLSKIFPQAKGDVLSYAKTVIPVLNKAAQDRSSGVTGAVSEEVRNLLGPINQYAPSTMSQISSGVAGLASQHPFGAMGLAYGGLTGKHESVIGDIGNAALDAGIAELGSKGAGYLMGRPALNQAVNTGIQSVGPAVSSSTATSPYTSRLGSVIDELFKKPQTNTQWTPPESATQPASPASAPTKQWVPPEFQ